DLVAARAARGGQPAHRRFPVPIAVPVAFAARFEDFLALGVGVEVVLVAVAVVVVLGEAEVNESSMPGIAQGHCGARFRPPAADSSFVFPRLAPPHTSTAVPRRTIVAPSCTATRQSWEVPIESRARPCSAASSA